ncbi:MAG: TatD family hydrolase [Lachnospiraceae bacterium]|nr:TatD family hydrolase [Lachnospiraceae bacterium]
MIIDTHAHYESKRFDEDREELLESMQGNGIGTIIDVGAAVEDLDAVIGLAEKYPFIYAAVGVHPYEIGDLNEESWKNLMELSLHPRTVAIGEFGLDYHEWPDEPPVTQDVKDAQIYWFRRQMGLARDRQLPFIIHSRDAAADTMKVLEEEMKPGMSGVMHCYSYSKEIAMRAVGMGLYIGVGGVVTFRNARKLKETVECIPLDRILLETDCPYMAPEPHRGKRNSSLYLPHVVRAISEIRGMTEAEVIQVTSENAKRLFSKCCP